MLIQEYKSVTINPVQHLKLKEMFTSNVEMHSKSPPTFSHIAVVASKLAVASIFPEGDHAHDLMVLVCVSSRTACTYFHDVRQIIFQIFSNPGTKHSVNKKKTTSFR